MDHRATAIQNRLSPEAHGAATALELKFPIVAVPVVVAVSLVKKTVVEKVVMSWQKTCQPDAAATGNPITPVCATPPVPTLITNEMESLVVTIDGEVPKPDEIIGMPPMKAAVLPPIDALVVPKTILEACRFIVLFAMTVVPPLIVTPPVAVSAPVKVQLAFPEHATLIGLSFSVIPAPLNWTMKLFGAA